MSVISNSLRATLLSLKQIKDKLADILSAIGNIDIDTTDLAKTGTDNSVTLTTMDAKLGDYVQATAAEEVEAMADLMNQLDNI